MLQAAKVEAGSGVEWKRVDAMVQAQRSSPAPAESLEAVTHDARNMVAALGLYCDLLEEPGVLSSKFSHYGPELRQVASASRRLVEKLAEFDRPQVPASPAPWRIEGGAAEGEPVRLPGNNRRRDVRNDGWDFMLPAAPVANLAAELLAARNLLSALASPAITVTVEAERGARPTRLTTEDLTRVLVNLVKNAEEAMPRGGRIQIRLRERAGQDGDWLVLTVEDSGPGIPEELLDRIFASGFTGREREDGRPGTHRGLGLAITRAIIETAGGRMHAENRISGGARMVMELRAGR